jgi:hypothetical protein
VVELTCPETVTLNGPGSVQVRASDAHSGLASDPSGTVTLDTSEVGEQVIERTATDNVGHSTTERCAVRVVYAYSGLGAPFASTGRTTIKAGSTLPLKFQLADASGKAIEGVVYEVELQRGDELVKFGEVTGDGKHGKYHFNLKTKGIAPGEWTLRIRLDDGASHNAPVTLR